MESLWKGTKEVPVISVLQHEEKRLRARAEEVQTPELKAAILRVADEAAATIAKRKADRRFWVEVRHVGSPASPLRWNELAATYASKTHALEVEARRGLLAQHGSPQAAAEAEGVDSFAEAVRGAVERNPARLEVILAHARACVEEGTVGGVDTVTRLLTVGKSGLLIHALEEVRAFQEVDPEMGEG